MTYQSLHVFQMRKHESPQAVDEEYHRRVGSPLTFTTSFKPYLMQREMPAGKSYPLFVVPTKKLLLLCDRLRGNSKKIVNLVDALPKRTRERFFHDQLVSEIKRTNDIEGVRSTREEIGVALKSGWKSNVRLASTVQLYLDILNQELPAVESLEDIGFLYKHLLKGEINAGDAVDGELFRAHGVHILSYQSNKVVHYAPQGEANIQQRLTDWLAFQDDNNYPSLIRAIVGHFMFENTHPFYDGNGRLGRYLLSVALAKELDAVTAVSLSQAIFEHRSSYYGAFTMTEDVKNRAEATFFIIKILGIIDDCQRQLIQRLQQEQDELDYFADWQVG